jgi:hypothetical protein
MIVGTATFWGCWALAVPTFVGLTAVGIIPFFIGFGALWWFYLGGVFHIVARTEGITVAAYYFRGLRQAPWKSIRDRTGRGWWRILLPSYFRRAARVLGWNENRVLVALGALLAVDLVVVVWMMATAPA